MEVDSEKERAILEHVWKTSVDPASLTDEDFERLKRVGLSDEEIVEVQEMIGLSFETIITFEMTTTQNVSEDSET